MMKMLSRPQLSTFSALSRQLLLASVAGLGLAATTVSAQEIRVWSGYPELAPFYQHVAEGMAAEYPDLKVTVEAIALREHEKRGKRVVFHEKNQGRGAAVTTGIRAAQSTYVGFIDIDMEVDIFSMLPLLQQIRLPIGHLDGIGTGLGQPVHGLRHILQPNEEARFVANPVIDGHIQATAIAEQPVHARLFRNPHHHAFSLHLC